MIIFRTSHRFQLWGDELKNKYRQWAAIIFSTILLSCLILDGQTALQGATDGVQICIRTIIPTLFPDIFLSSLLCSYSLGRQVPLIAALARRCGVPSGAESILLLGFVGGYPVGAKLVTDSYRQGHLSKSSAQRMLGFCSNAGPSFIFGILTTQFSNPFASWLLWLVHILSAVAVGLILPGKERYSSTIAVSSHDRIPSVLQQSLKSVATISGWVILFRVLLSFLDRWWLAHLSPVSRVCIIGVLELVNGCIGLQGISCEAVRWILANCILAWGGLCVTMQTASVTANLGLGKYIPGKLLHVAISGALATPVCYLLYPTQLPYWLLLFPLATFLVIAIAVIRLHRHKKVVAIS